MHSMLARFKELFEDSNLVECGILAGVFARLGFARELLHTVWLAACY